MVKKEIALLSKETIDQIAAGEVVERPASVVKELVENAMDAGADAITVEIRDGGTSYIRITDNGCGIPKEQLPVAFLRHATSKLTKAEELSQVHTLGFRGEALSSIGAVAHVEMITKPPEQFIGCRYVMEGSREISIDDVGAPDGTTIMVYHLFYNTPARRKFLKSNTTEAGYIAELMERLALSHPAVSFCLITNKKEKLHTSGNGNLYDTIYQIYGREMASLLLKVEWDSPLMRVDGFLGNALIARGNRSLESFFVDGRYVKSSLLSKAVEEGYHGYLMQHQYPFCVLQITTKEASVDVNVHPTKQEVRFGDEEAVYQTILDLVYDCLHPREDIARIQLPEPVSAKEETTEPAPGFDDADTSATAEIPSTAENPSAAEMPSIVENPSAAEMPSIVENPSAAEKSSTVEIPSTADSADISKSAPEPFEKNRLEKYREQITREIHKDSPYERQYREFYEKQEPVYEQACFLSSEEVHRHRIIGQVFDTYWLIEYQQELYIIDQHAAHEKVLYERTMAALQKKEMTSQMISPPIIITLSAAEQQVLEDYREVFVELGFAVAPFGGNEFALTGIPGNLFSIDPRQMFMDVLNECSHLGQRKQYDRILEKVASMSCKAAVKGNDRLSEAEARQLIDDLLSLENPYHCPHGRPTIISMTKQELEKKFKRIV